jgi:hypothetical protein
MRDSEFRCAVAQNSRAIQKAEFAKLIREVSKETMPLWPIAKDFSRLCGSIVLALNPQSEIAIENLLIILAGSDVIAMLQFSK